MDDLLETGPRCYSEDSRGILHLHGALHGLLESALLPCLSLPLDFFLCFALRRQQSNKQVIYPCFSFLFFLNKYTPTNIQCICLSFSLSFYSEMTTASTYMH
ncbi:hypothetical protein PVAP13_1KG056400 [Panicum virgatum]|uniref:Uncharacterized protein n=1 Tax=Panicum virgatum TaxID=38727 RepID=A0A8T0X318_PANVG|nr:hypothetical protein PVAP13_1KG056400 [Panicum virgatum]